MTQDKKNSKAEADLDSLLDFDDVLPEKSEAVPSEAPVEVEDEAQKEIARLKAELAKARTRPTDSEGKPLPEHVLTPEQREIRVLDDLVAQKKAREFEESEDVFDTVEGDGILIHVVEDGFTAQGRVWYRGQEIEFVPGSIAHDQTFDRFGHSWLDYNESEQMRQYGRVMFRRGPWPGNDYEETAAAAEERKRRRAAPIATA